MKEKLRSASFLFSYAWAKKKLLFLTEGLSALFHAILPLIDITGLGLIIDALTGGDDKRKIIRLILLYLIINFTVSILSILFTFANNSVKRQTSDMVQLDYMRSCLYINYHYVQDRSILDLKKKSMGAQPAWFLGQVGTLLRYIIQFFGIILIFASLSPFFIVFALLSSVFSVFLSFTAQNKDFEYQNARAAEDRKLNYLYQTMTDYKFAKEVRIAQAGELISKKYSNILRYQFQKLASFVQLNINTYMQSSSHGHTSLVHLSFFLISGIHRRHPYL